MTPVSTLIRRLTVCCAVTVVLLVGLTGPGGAAVVAQSPERTIEVVELSGPIDDRSAAFARSAIANAADSGDVEVVILQIDSPGVTADPAEFEALFDLVADPPLAVVTWVGPTSAQAKGGAAQLLAAAPLRAAAPGVHIGRWAPTIAGEDDSEILVAPPTERLLGEPIRIDQPVEGLVDMVADGTSSPRQLIQLLDGTDVGGQVLKTVRPFTGDDGVTGVTTLVTVYREPGLIDRTLRLSATPEAAFFFLIAGLTVAAFEFYAIGPGIAAGVASVSLLLSASGLASLSVRWWALLLAMASTWLMAVSYQRGGVVALSGAGLVGLTISGFTLTGTAPQIPPSAPGVLLTVGAAAFFFLLAMPTVARSRFSTQTIGRESLIGVIGMAVGPLDPDGTVEVDGARWSATSHRQAGIAKGDLVTVVAIDGWVLDVEPADSENPL